MPTYAAPAKKKPHDPTKWLRKSRSVLIYGPIEPKLTKEVTAQILLLDTMSAEKPIKVYVNSPGGVADDGFALYDLFRFVRAPVYTIVTGMAASAATILLLGAKKGRRLVTPSARVMLHQPSTMIRGTAADIAVSAKELIRLRKKANDLYARETGRPVEQIEKELARDHWMSADEAVAYGIVDRIVANVAEVER
ncbi:MAG: ATP-dependent Clp protease proteolytic subunit [Planctomycetes bacterium]|nr:ATP-dependent Clp protease proteolytic subunit [Planctomycetota bacterium]